MSDPEASPIPRPSLRSVALGIVRDLLDAGHTTYLAGGCVRDRVMGNEPNDYDIATDARPEEVRRLFRGARSVGESFGVVLVRRSGYVIEVATFRTDGVYSDGRHPDSVAFGDAEHDARRRDFTINGLFEHPATGEIVDYVGGRADIEARVVRAIGDASARLGEDRLRMLRAIRFAARFHFAIEPETAEAIREEAAGLRGVTRERIGQEIRWMLTDPNRAVAVWELQYLGLDAPVLDEPTRTVAPRRLGRLPDDASYPTALAAWLLDRHEAGEGDAGAAARRWSSALVLSNREAGALTRSLEIHDAVRGPWPGLGVAAQKRLAADPLFEQGLLLLLGGDPQAFVDVQRRVVELAGTGLRPEPLLTGEDLITAGLRPGPAFRRILEGVYDGQLEGGVRTREEAMDLARAIAAGDPPDAGNRPPG